MLRCVGFIVKYLSFIIAAYCYAVNSKGPIEVRICEVLTEARAPPFSASRSSVAAVVERCQRSADVEVAA